MAVTMGRTSGFRSIIYYTFSWIALELAGSSVAIVRIGVGRHSKVSYSTRLPAGQGSL